LPMQKEHDAVFKHPFPHLRLCVVRIHSVTDFVFAATKVGIIAIPCIARYYYLTIIKGMRGYKKAVVECRTKFSHVH